MNSQSSRHNMVKFRLIQVDKKGIFESDSDSCLIERVPLANYIGLNGIVAIKCRPNDPRVL